MPLLLDLEQRVWELFPTRVARQLLRRTVLPESSSRRECRLLPRALERPPHVREKMQVPVPLL